MTHTENFELHRFEGFSGIEENSSFPHQVELVGEKFKQLSSNDTNEWCGTLNGVFSKYFEEKGIDFTAALNSLPNKIS